MGRCRGRVTPSPLLPHLPPHLAHGLARGVPTTQFRKVDFIVIHTSKDLHLHSKQRGFYSIKTKILFKMFLKNSLRMTACWDIYVLSELLE